MRTQLMIMLIVAAVALAAAAALIGLIVWLGWQVGVAVAIGLLALVVVLYLRVIKPWHLRWGATDEEVARVMPGDELISGASSATRAISINASPEQVWPWLVQLGYGVAGCYSYDWIDNDFRRSADRVLEDH